MRLLAVVNKAQFNPVNTRCETHYTPTHITQSIKLGHHTFDTLWSYNMKLNPSKCTFGVMIGKFLGFVVSQRGIEANLDKIWAVMEMTPLTSIKEVQSLNGKVTALNRFVSRAIDKCLPFFRMLKKSFERTAECQQAFEDLKAYLSSPSLLSPSKLGEELFLYLAVSSAAISVALVKEEDRVQKPVYTLARLSEAQKKGTHRWRSSPLH